MVRLAIAMFFLLLSACGGKSSSTADLTFSVPAEFLPYVARFLEVAKTEGNNTEITNLVVTGSSMVDDAMLGYCQKLSDGTNEIVININWWNGTFYSDGSVKTEPLPIIEREELMFHELGHCVLNRIQDDSEITADDVRGETIQKTIMNSHHLGEERYESNYDYYMKELFLNVSTDPVARFYDTVNEWTGASYYASLISKPVVLKSFKMMADGVTVTQTGHISIKGIQCGD